MDIRQIKYFVALYEEGSVTKAAKRMHVVQAAISQQIKRLEVDAGVLLFVRESHGVVPSTLAHEFYRHSIDILTELERAEAVLSNGANRVNGRLVIGAQASFNQFVLGAALETFHERFPNVEVIARDGYRSDLVEWLNQGALDLALLSTTKDLLNMQTLSIFNEDLVVVGHRDTLAGRDVIEGAELANFKLVLPSRYKSMRNLIDAQFGLQGLTLAPELEIDSLQSLLHLTMSADWISIVPSIALSSKVHGDALVAVALRRPTIRRNAVIAWPRHKTLDAPMRSLVDIVSQTMARIPGVELSGPTT